MSEQIQDIRVDRSRLVELMKLRGFTNDDLARRMGKHPNTVVNIKREQATTLENLEKLCAALKCHPLDLMVFEGYPEPFSDAPASL